jgi:UDP-glucose 4-epimerase
MLLAANEKVVGGVFNLGNIEEVSIAELARKIITVTSSKVGIEYIPYAKAYEEGFEDMERRVPDLTKVNSFTGYSPRIDLDQSLCLIRDWFVNERIVEEH